MKNLIDKLYENENLTREDMLALLNGLDEDSTEYLHLKADRKEKSHTGIGYSCVD